MAVTHLGLIGDNIARSQSPRLHVEAGKLCGIKVIYDRLIPRDLGLNLDTVFDRCADEGFRGINVTYPYKEEVVRRVVIPDAATAAIRACNTVLFGDGRPEGHNTDCTGFVSAFGARFGTVAPGRVAMAGAGGVGKAIAFGLARLGATELHIFDRDRQKADALATAVAAAADMTVGVAGSIEEAAEGADGLVNCTPIGMTGHPGTAVPADNMRAASWAFDAVYTPVDTLFLTDAAKAGLEVMSGYDLFFHQGVDAFRIFTGLDVDAAALRRILAPESLQRADP